MDYLTVSEAARLAAAENVIRQGLETFIAVGNALVEIRDAKLYRAEYPTFEEYCNRRWNLQRRRAYQLIEASQVVNNLSPMGDITESENVQNFAHLPNEAQARVMAKLPADEQRAAWQQVVETAPDGKITAGHVERVVEESFRVEIAPTFAPQEAPPLGPKSAPGPGASSPKLGTPGAAGEAAPSPKRSDGFKIPVIGNNFNLGIDWKCHNCGQRQPAGTIGTFVEINGGRWQICPVCIPDYRKRAGLPTFPDTERDEFLCPRCEGRTGRLNGGAICLECEASWKTRAEYESELEAYLEDLDAPPMTVDFSGVSTVEMAHDLAALETAGYGEGPMAERLREELAKPLPDRQALTQEITAVFERVLEAATAEHLMAMLTWLRNLEVK